MFDCKFVVTAWFLSGIAFSVFAQLPDVGNIRSSDAKSAVTEYESARKQLNGFYVRARSEMDAKYREEMQKCKSALLERLESARKTATVNDQLDEAIKIRDFIAGCEDIDIAPPDAVSQKKGDHDSQVRELQRRIAELEKQAAESQKAMQNAGKEPTLASLHANMAGSWMRQDGQQVWTFRVDGTVRAVNRDGSVDRGWSGTLAFTATGLCILTDDGRYRHLALKDLRTIQRSGSDGFILTRMQVR